MTKSIKRSLILAAAASAVSIGVATSAQAQYRLNTGRANDANNRVGGGGINPENTKVNVTANDIVYGNVTGGKEFHGRVESGDPKAFRGNLGERPSDNFVRGSSGTPYAADSGANSNAQNVRPFYGDSRGVAPPDGFIRTSPGSTGYIPSDQPDLRLGSDLRLGQVTTEQTIQLPQPGETVLPGPVDPSTQNDTLFTMSPLYGVRQWNAGNASDQAFVARYANVFGNAGTDRSGMNDLQIDAMRRELQQAAGAQGQNVGQNDLLSGQNLNNAQQQNGATNGNGTAPDSNLAQPLPPSLGSPNNQALPQGQLQSSVNNNALPTNLSTGEGVQARMLVPAAQQSTANAELQARLDQLYGKKPETDVDRARDFNKQLIASQNAQKNGQPGEKQPGANQPGAGQHDNGTTPAPAPGETPAVPGPTGAGGAKSAPPQIKSFASGVKAKGLGELLQKSEDLMKQGKWFSAIEQYDLAQQVAPNNMLIAVGRANAELGGSYYGRAEADLRRAFTQDPATLEGQYDLRTMIGDDRLQFLVNDLKDIATKNPTQARPLFLLSYIAYNTGNEKMAAGYLDLAEKRAGAGDTFYAVVRKHWVLPEKSQTPAPDLNKQ